MKKLIIIALVLLAAIPAFAADKPDRYHGLSQMAVGRRLKPDGYANYG